MRRKADTRKTLADLMANLPEDLTEPDWLAMPEPERITGYRAWTDRQHAYVKAHGYTSSDLALWRSTARRSALLRSTEKDSE